MNESHCFETKSGNDTDRLDASVIIATRNRANVLAKTLTHLSNQRLGDCAWEVVVVDNGSTDATQSVLASAGRSLPLIALLELRPGKNSALNRALDVAQGDLLVFTDDDVIPSDEWIVSLVNAARRWPSDSVFSGPVVPHFPDGTARWMAHARFRYSGFAFGRYQPTCGEGAVEMCPFGGNLAFRQSVFRDVRYSEAVGPDGTKSYAMGSETELLGRLAKEGKRFIYVPEAMVYHVIRKEQTTATWLVQRAKCAGRGSAFREVEYPGPWFFGAPRYRWRELMCAMGQRLLSSFCGEEARCLARMRSCKILGCLAEHRRLRKSRTP